ncbi:MAG: undecaprenyl-diphosphate phosphatase [Acidimicrobiales bacterium]
MTAAVAHIAHPLSYFQAIVMGLLQGVTELVPISSLGHSVLLPKLLGWNDLVRFQSESESPFLAFLVGLHVATATALLVFYRDEWFRLLAGLFRSLRRRRVETADERLIWLLIVATIPAGLIGLIFEHSIRTLFAKPLAAAVFLTLNGLVLLAGERYRRRLSAGVGPQAAAEGRPVPGAPPAPRGPAVPGAPPAPRGPAVPGASPAARGPAVPGASPAARGPAAPGAVAPGTTGRSRERGRLLATLDYREAGVVGVAQVFALFAGISRSGITMVAGLVRGLNHEDAARFSFLLATPIIAAAGVYKLPDLFGANGNGIRGQVLAGSLVAGLAAYATVRFLVRWFETRTLTPFALYCLVVGAALTVAWGLF